MVIKAGAEAADAARANTIEPSALDEIAGAQDALDKLSDTLQEKMMEFHRAQETFESAMKKQAKMLKAVQASQRAQAAQKKAGRLSTLSSPPASPSSTPSTTDGEIEFAKRLDSLKDRLREGQKLMPRSGGTFVQLFVGCINIGFDRKSERLAFKSEYELMKSKFAPFGVVFCIICLSLPGYRWVHMIFQLCLSWYYVTLAIRENILRLNGSNIRPWWIVHHYLTMMQSVFLLTWPQGDSYSRFQKLLHVFGLYNSLLMIFQTRYQMARLYTLRSLGRANEMDVASSDSTQIHWSETMTLLLPLIVLGQMMQGYMATFLYRLFSQYPNELQIMMLALLFSANFIGNVLTTVQVLLAKRHTAKRSASSTSSSTTNSLPTSVPRDSEARTAAEKDK